MSGKWFAGITALLLVSVALSGCVAEAKAFYIAKEEPKEGTGTEINLTAEAPTISYEYDSYLVKSIFFNVLGAGNGKINITIGDKEEPSISLDLDAKGNSTYTAVDEENLKVGEQVSFKTKEDDVKVGARKEILNKGIYLTNETLTINCTSADKSVVTANINWKVTFLYFAAWKKGDNPEYKMTAKIDWTKVEAPTIEANAFTLADLNAYAVNVTVEGTTWTGELNVSVKFGDDEKFNATFATNETIKIVKLYSFNKENETLGWFPDDEYATKALNLMDLEIAPTTMAAGDYTVTTSKATGFTVKLSFYTEAEPYFEQEE